ncbi:hypothetical protein K432DRAFT_386781 [Lepidopterella palustris CBS 459.81]|uniref:Uncharacterized protein n=1 Tax=Lepidopterella palustris CBS 459.81 TaxID=1314670 RepID=A0A8E2J9K0_9PEZI|nr:hypothetical protein K432DRAFT_386781 [Lepidopterella palustris CBS 459.81]
MAPVRPKFYYLVPTTDVPPGGPIRLGSLVSVPRLVADPINENPVPPESFAEKVFVHTAANQTVNISKNVGGHAGIFGEFLQSLGIGGTVEGEASNNHSEEWNFAVKTIWFTPSTEYVKKSLEDMEVQDFIRENKTWLGRKKLYMVTGVKIAYGASSTVSYARNRSLNLNVGFDFTPLGVPITVGPDGGIQSGLTVTQSEAGADPFVFAFRLRQVKVSAAGNVEHKDFNRGAMLSLPGGKRKGKEDEIEIVVEGLDEYDVQGSEFMLQSQSVVDEVPSEGSECKCARTT